MNWLYGIRGYSFFDAWTIAHISFWAFIGSCLYAFKVKWEVALLFAISGSFMWEVTEYFLSQEFTQVWLSQESWWNSWISDPLTSLVGVLGMYLLLSKGGTKSLPEK